MSKPAEQFDALVLGEHPAAYLAAALLRVGKPALRVMHATIPGDGLPDRLVTINPAFFDLHPLLTPVKRKLDLSPLYGVRFLADDPRTSSEHHGKSIMAYVAAYADVRDALHDVAKANGVDLATPKSIEALAIHHVDDTGLDATVGKHVVRAKALILAGTLPAAQHKMLGVADGWEPGVHQRFTYLRAKSAKRYTPGNKPVAPMSLDLGGQLRWAWLLPAGEAFQLMVAEDASKATATSGQALLAKWVQVLRGHGVLESDLPTTAAESVTLPVSGALSQEGLGNRTLLIGPAGGFFSACGEDIYPNCWSALFAADTLAKALKQTHLQDALNPFRQEWRTTLGEYLRGPHENLRYLLPLVYRNPVMTTRLAESIFFSKDLVR